MWMMKMRNTRKIWKSGERSMVLAKKMKRERSPRGRTQMMNLNQRSKKAERRWSRLKKARRRKGRKKTRRRRRTRRGKQKRKKKKKRKGSTLKTKKRQANRRKRSDSYALIVYLAIKIRIQQLNYHLKLVSLSHEWNQFINMLIHQKLLDSRNLFLYWHFYSNILCWFFISITFFFNLVMSVSFLFSEIPSSNVFNLYLYGIIFIWR